MIRFVTLSFLLVLVLSLVMGAALLIGRYQPAPERVERMHLTDCDLPCWNTITPGSSLPGEVESQIDTTFPQFKRFPSNGLPFLIWRLDDAASGAKTTINVVFEKGVAARMSIGTNFPSERWLRLGDMLALFGSPTCVASLGATTYSTLSYENADHQVVLQFTIDQPSLFSPVTNILVYFSNKATCQTPSARPWREFLNMQHVFFAAF